MPLPCLKLFGAHLLAKLVHYCTELIQTCHKISLLRYWSDSTVTLEWTRTPPFRLKVHITNRISQIQEWISPGS